MRAGGDNCGNCSIAFSRDRICLSPDNAAAAAASVRQTWEPRRSISCGRCLNVRQVLELQTKAIRRFVITEKAPTRAFSWLKAATTAFTFKTQLRHYAERALTPRSLNVKLGPRRNYHKGRAAIRHYANQSAHVERPFSIVS